MKNKPTDQDVPGKTFQGSSNWRAGFGRLDITPPEPIWLCGWGDRMEPSCGVSHPIHVKAIALAYGDSPPSVILTSDLMALSVEMTAAVAQAAGERYGIERRRLILASSHNHSAPVTTNVLPHYYTLTDEQWQVVHRYTAWAQQRFIEAIGLALDDLADARLSMGQSFAGFAVNRRRRYPGFRHLPGLVDHDVPVLAVRTPGGAVRGVLFGYACHATAVKDGTVNGDYPGYAQAAIERDNPGAMALFFAGCGGDANPLPRHRPGLGQHYGEILAAAVQETLDRDLTPLQGPLGAAYGEVDLPFENPPTRAEVLEKIATCGARQLLAKLVAGEPMPASYRYPIQVWRFGPEHTLIAMSSEVVVDYALRFKQTYGVETTLAMAYTNEHIAYIPSRRVREEGGYEGSDGMWECGLPAPFMPQVEQIIARKVDELVKEAAAATIANPSNRI